MGNNRTKYDREFKISIVKMVLQGIKTMRVIAKDMGVDYSTLSKWKRDYNRLGEAAFPGSGKVVYGSEAEVEIARLKKEL